MGSRVGTARTRRASSVQVGCPRVPRTLSLEAPGGLCQPLINATRNPLVSGHWVVLRLVSRACATNPSWLFGSRKLSFRSSREQRRLWVAGVSSVSLGAGPQGLLSMPGSCLAPSTKPSQRLAGPWRNLGSGLDGSLQLLSPPSLPPRSPLFPLLEIVAMPSGWFCSP